jgi:sialate O-acetylesterase
VWGWAEPRAEVTVEFAEQKNRATAEGDGKWSVELDPLDASSDERELTVTTARGESLIRKGVLVGEVWFASGQSNMVRVARKSMCAGLANEVAIKE